MLVFLCKCCIYKSPSYMNLVGIQTNRGCIHEQVIVSIRLIVSTHAKELSRSWAVQIWFRFSLQILIPFNSRFGTCRVTDCVVVYRTQIISLRKYWRNLVLAFVLLRKYRSNLILDLYMRLKPLVIIPMSFKIFFLFLCGLLK